MATVFWDAQQSSRKHILKPLKDLEQKSAKNKFRNLLIKSLDPSNIAHRALSGVLRFQGRKMCMNLQDWSKLEDVP